MEPLDSPSDTQEAPSDPQNAPYEPIKVPTNPLDALTDPLEAPTNLIEAARYLLEAPTDPFEATTCSQHAPIGTTSSLEVSADPLDVPVVPTDPLGHLRLLLEPDSDSCSPNRGTNWSPIKSFHQPTVGS